MSGTSLATGERKFVALLPGITSALSFSAADILGKVVFNDGMDVLSFITARGVLTVLFFWFWLRGAPPARSHTRRERIVSIVMGVMFAANVFCLLLAIQLLTLSIAILTYFIYPLLTGLAGAATGIDRVGWQACGRARCVHRFGDDARRAPRRCGGARRGRRVGRSRCASYRC
jgi:drug/metabolite transporter (DMT)-like permease